jgi:gamma-glutamyltranspeptidase/glutathione hydrolase
VEAEPGIDSPALDRLGGRGWKVRRWSEQNLFFGGVQAVARQPETGALSGGGDPRRGGVATVVD